MSVKAIPASDICHLILMAKAKEIEGLDCGAGAAEGIGLVLLARLEEMCEFRAAVLDLESAAGGVHDMRVASRRLRSVLRDFLPYVRRGKRLDAARAELKRLADALGAVRDEDVAIAALEKLKGEAPESAVEGLELFAEERRVRREAARAVLTRALEEESFGASWQRLRRAFEKATGTRSGKRGGSVEGGEGELSFRGVGRRVIGRSWNELLALGPGLYRPFKSRRLHKTRIAAKRLRYALELFSTCWGDALKEPAHELARLQTALGELHDCDEWIEECGQLLSEQDGTRDLHATEAESFAPERRAAAFRLLEHFVQERTKHYTEALALWREWELNDFAARLDERLRSDGE
jgi:CHAD domain-containing protein